MTGYPMVPLGEILELSQNTVAVEPDETYRLAGVYSFGRGLFTRPTITGAETQYPSVRQLRHNQLVYGRLNAWEGALAVVGPEFDGFVVSPEFPTFDIRPTRAVPGYLDWLTRWPGLWDSLLVRAKGIGSQRGARRRRVPVDRFLATSVPLPTLDEQSRIVERMERAERLRMHAGGAARLADALVHSTFDAMLASRGLRGQSFVPLGEILELAIDEFLVEPDKTYRISGVFSFGRGLFERPPISGSETKYPWLHRLHEGQLVYSRLKVWEGAVSVVEAAFDGSFVSPEYPTFNVRSERATRDFVRWLSRWPTFWDQLLGQSQGVGARRERVPVDRLLATTVPLPSLERQRRIVERLDRVDRVRRRALDAAKISDALVLSTFAAALAR